MSNRFFNKCFFILLFGVPLAFFTAYVINIRENSNFKRSYTGSSVYKYGQGVANYVNREVIGKKVLGNVHFGKNGKLFYLPKSDGNVWNDLYGNKVVQKDFSEKWNNYFDKFKSHPGYYFIVAPNKERVLVKNLNLYVLPQLELGTRPYDLMPRKQNVVFPGEDLLEDDYFVSDTHWNLLAAQKVIRKVFKLKNIDTKYLDSINKDESLREGDITRMINTSYFTFYPSLNREKDLSLRPDRTDKTVVIHEEIELFKNRSSHYNLSVLVIGDSFRESIASLLADMTATVHSVKFNQKEYLENLKLSDYDLILDVRVERYLNTVTDYKLKR
jgi:hypothetical protein